MTDTPNQPTGTAAEQRIDELNKEISVIGPIIKGETWKVWAWRVKDYLEERIAALKQEAGL